jgi:release factor glutamine methyltransferase
MPAAMDGGTISWRALLAETARIVGDRRHARWLCEVASGMDGGELLAALDEPATERAVAHLDAMTARRRTGEPLQYVLGSWQFRRLDLLVDRRVLIPRPETEWVCQAALDALDGMARPLSIADLGTGSGAIGLSLAAELPPGTATVWVTDVSPDALDVARANLAGLGRAAAAVRVAEGSWFAALPADLRGRLDLVVANPPYIAAGDPDVGADVHEWEPHGALYAGADGLDAIREIVSAAPEWLRPGGVLVLEIGASQGASVSALIEGAGMAAEIRRDPAGRDRIAVGHTVAAGS